MDSYVSTPPILTGTILYCWIIILCILEKNSLWCELNIQKRQLCVNKNLAQDLGFVCGFLCGGVGFFGVELAKSPAPEAIACFEDLRLNYWILRRNPENTTSVLFRPIEELYWIKPLFLWIKMNSEQPLLLLRMKSVSDLLGDQGGVAAGAVVNDEVHLDFVFCSLVHDLNGILDHLRIQHAGNHFVVVENGGRPLYLQFS